MTTVRQVMSKRNDLLMKLAFSNDISEVKKLYKQVEALDYEIKCMTLN